MNLLTEVARNARAEILLNVEQLLSLPPPASEVERAARLDYWEQVGNALREYFAAADLRDRKLAELVETHAQVRAYLEEQSNPDAFLR